MRVGVLIGSAPMDFGRSGQLLEVEESWGQPSEPLIEYETGESQCLVMRRHGTDASIAPHEINYRANIWQMVHHNVDCIVATHTVGGIDRNLAVGALVLPDNLIDYTWGRPSTFDDYRRHIEFTYPYDSDLQAALVRVYPDIVSGGVYGCTQGPRLESAAEIQRMAQDGCTLVGMTGMPEAALAREQDVRFVSVCLVVNPAAGIVPGSVDMAELRRTSEQGARDFESLILRFCGA